MRGNTGGTGRRKHSYTAPACAANVSGRGEYRILNGRPKQHIRTQPGIVIHDPDFFRPHGLPRLAAKGEYACKIRVHLHLFVVARLGKRAASPQNRGADFSVPAHRLFQGWNGQLAQFRLERIHKHKAGPPEKSRHHTSEGIHGRRPGLI